MPYKETEPLESVRVNLYRGDSERLIAAAGECPRSEIIRRLVRRFILIREGEIARAQAVPLRLGDDL